MWVGFGMFAAGGITAPSTGITGVARRRERELNTPTAVITHNAVICGMTDRVLALADGQIVSDRHNEHRRLPEELVW